MPESPVAIDFQALGQLVKPTDERQALAVPAAPPVSPIDQGLFALGQQVAAQPEQRKSLECKALLQGDTLRRAQAEAVQEFPKLLGNTQAMMAFGTPAVEGVNKLVDKLLKEVEPTKIPEVISLTKKLNDNMRGVKNKYDVSDPGIRRKYEKYASKGRSIFNGMKTMFEMLVEDIASTEKQLDKVRSELRSRQENMLRNVVYYDQFYKANEAEILNLIYAIGVMELIVDQAEQAAAAVTVGDATLGDRGGERRSELLDFASNMKVKIGEYKSRLFVAWSTSPQIRNMRTLDIGVAEKLNELANLTIPTMKQTLIQWRMMMQTYQAKQLGEAVAETSNEWLKAYAAAGAEMVPEIAQMIQEPTMQAATFAAIADSFSKQSDGIIAALEKGDERRAENDEAMMAASDIMRDASRRVNDAQLRKVLSIATRELPAEISQSVPAVTAVPASRPQPQAAPVTRVKQFDPFA